MPVIPRWLHRRVPRPLGLFGLQRELADVAAAVKRVSHAGDDPWRRVDLRLVAGDAHGPLWREIRAAIGERDFESEDARLNAQPFGSCGGERILSAREGRAQFLGAPADAGHDRAAVSRLDVGVHGAHAAVRIAIGAAPSVLVAVDADDRDRRQLLAARRARGAEEQLSTLNGADAVVGLRESAQE